MTNTNKREDDSTQKQVGKGNKQIEEIVEEKSFTAYGASGQPTEKVFRVKDVKELLKSYTQARVAETLTRCAEILHTYAMKTTDLKTLDLIEEMQQDIIKTIQTPPKEL